MTPNLLDELEKIVALSEKATPGEWFTNYAVSAVAGRKPEVTEFYVYSPSAVEDVAIAADIIDPETDKPSDANAELIARSVNFLRTHAPALADMAKRLEAAERDAARYRWLRDHNNVIGEDGITECSVEIFINGESHAPGHLDAQVDAAIDATQEGAG